MILAHARPLVASLLALALVACGGGGGGNHSFVVPPTDGGVSNDMTAAAPGDMGQAMSMNCMGGQVKCLGLCIDVNQDAANCGGCGKACAAGMTCSAGTCVGCALPQISCKGACVTTDTDVNNCGACSHVCQQGQSCTAGQCSGCPRGQLDCNFGCTDVTSDSNNCGGCNNSCNGLACKNGRCACPNGQSMCNGACANLLTDVSNCGKCGNACGQGQMCQNGACAGGNLNGCNGGLGCIEGCGNNQCVMACENSMTAKGKQLLIALFTCLETACPSMNGGVCDANSGNFVPADCDTCYSDAQMPNGDCDAALTSCQNNGP